jgi:hypothetical protein
MGTKKYDLIRQGHGFQFFYSRLYIYIHLTLVGESMIKYTFHDPCQEKCKVAINQALTYQNFKILFNLIINMNIFFELCQ